MSMPPPLSRRALLAGAATASAAHILRPRAAGAAPAAPSAAAAAGTSAEDIKSHAAPYPTVGSIERLDPALDAIIPPGAKLEKLAEGFDWSEGPLWIKARGYLLFSDVPRNVIYRWQEGKGVSVFMRPSGYHGDRKDYREPGSNGLALNPRGELVMCQHGNRRVAKLSSWRAPQGKQVALAERYDGKRFNSPNDLVYHPSGDLFFTDPPYGLPKQMDDAEKELPFQGVYRLDRKGTVHLVSQEMERPNGVGLSPDGKTLYVGNSYGKRPIVMAFRLADDMSSGGARVFFDGRSLAAKDRKGGFDGLAVDRKGNIFTTGPGGVLILSPAGKHLGTILTGQATANCKFGGEGGHSLFITADSYLGRIATSTRGL